PKATPQSASKTAAADEAVALLPRPRVKAEGKPPSDVSPAGMTSAWAEPRPALDPPPESLPPGLIDRVSEPIGSSDVGDGPSVSIARGRDFEDPVFGGDPVHLHVVGLEGDVGAEAIGGRQPDLRRLHRDQESVVVTGSSPQATAVEGEGETRDEDHVDGFDRDDRSIHRG